MAKSITTVNPVRRSKLHKAALAAMAGAGYAPAEYEVVHVDLFGDGTAAVHIREGQGSGEELRDVVPREASRADADPAARLQRARCSRQPLPPAGLSEHASRMIDPQGPWTVPFPSTLIP
jgi:hypothetical protein